MAHRSTTFLLSHDMTPTDPRTYAAVAANPAPTNSRFRGFPEASMETSRGPAVMAADPARGAFVMKGTLDATDPGKSAPGAPANFYAGMHSSGLTKSFMDPAAKQQAALIGAETERKQIEERQTRNKELREHITDYKQQKIERASTMAAEKRKDLDQLKDYDPWGKPGAGAPRGQEQHLVSTERQINQDLKRAPPTYVDKAFGKSGGGAPMRTNSGKVKTGIVADPECAIPNVYRDNPNIDRDYTFAKTVVPSYGTDLQAQVERSKTMNAEKRAKSAELAAAHKTYDPYGKAGGGAPVRDQEGLLHASRTTKLQDTYTTRSPSPNQKKHYGEVLRQQLVQRDELRQTAAVADGPSSYDPWGKGQGQPKRNDSGKVRRVKPTEATGKFGVSLVDALGKPGGGAPFDRSQTVVPEVPKDAYHPFGKSGAGAPIKDDKGALTTKVTGAAELELAGVLQQRERENAGAKKAYLNELKVEMREREMTDVKQKQELRSPDKPSEFFKFGEGSSSPRRDPKTGELSPMKRSKTDVVAYAEDARGQRAIDPKAKLLLSTDLSKLLDERQQTTIDQRQNERMLESQHLQNYGKWQGKGTGAPRRDDNGEVYGRRAAPLDAEIHATEPSTIYRQVPLEDRIDYQTALDRQATEKSVERQSRRKVSAVEASRSDVTKNFGKPGYGAPLRRPDGNVETSPTKMIPKGDVEYKLGSKPAKTIE